MTTEALASARERFDPPVLRARWTTEAALSAGELVAEIRARTGWDAELVERLLRHGGVHLDGRPHGGAALPARGPAGTRVDLHARAREPAPIAVAADRLPAARGDWLPTH